MAKTLITIIMKNSVLRFGIYGLLVAFIIFIVALAFGQALDYSTQEIIGYASMIVSLAFVFFGIKHYRDKVNDGRVSFGKALLIGVLISLITAIGTGLADFIYTTNINPDFFEEYKAVMESQGYEGEIPEYSSGFMAVIMFLTVAVIGVIITLISALILQKNN